jgi:hypothetical protein
MWCGSCSALRLTRSLIPWLSSVSSHYHIAYLQHLYVAHRLRSRLQGIWCSPSAEPTPSHWSAARSLAARLDWGWELGRVLGLGWITGGVQEKQSACLHRRPFATAYNEEAAAAHPWLVFIHVESPTRRMITSLPGGPDRSFSGTSDSRIAPLPCNPR